MASNSTKKVQERIFGSGGRPPPVETGDGPIDGIPFPSADSITKETPTPLTINIPKPSNAQTGPPRKNTAPSPRNTEDYALQPYRLRLAEKLGDSYKGAEKYRLEQDDKREKHWKRWGPYLSDRQWVMLSLLLILGVSTERSEI